MRTSNPLELLLYPSTIEQTSKQEQEHPYQNGMFISINNHKTDAGKIIQQFPRQYQTLIHSVCNRKISREDIRVTKNLPPAYKISNLVASKKLIVVGGIHDYKQQDKYGNGSRTNFYHQHTHLYVYGVHHFLPINKELLEDAEKQICQNFQRYTGTSNKRYCLVKVAPVGTGIHRFTDMVTPNNIYEYLLTANPAGQQKSLLHYIANNRHNPSIQYPLHYLYEA